jgi:hypothetical protein
MHQLEMIDGPHKGALAKLRGKWMVRQIGSSRRY